MWGILQRVVAASSGTRALCAPSGGRAVLLHVAPLRVAPWIAHLRPTIVLEEARTAGASPTAGRLHISGLRPSKCNLDHLMTTSCMARASQSFSLGVIVRRAFVGAVLVEVHWELTDAQLVRPFVPVPAVAVRQHQPLAIHEGLAAELLNEKGDAGITAVLEQL